MDVCVVDHPLAAARLTTLRDERTGNAGFRAALRDLTHMLVYEATRDAPAEEISIADVIRAVDGPLANVRGDRPENMEYRGAAAPLTDVWIAVRAALRDILETTTLAHLRDGQLPLRVAELADDPEAWVSLGRIRGATPSGGRKAAQPKVSSAKS